MARAGIISIAGFIPRLRLQRSAAVDAMGWANSSLAGMANGCRSLCGHDEDSVTMAVEAGRLCLAAAPSLTPRELHFATTTAPFADRAQSVLTGEAIGLSSDLRCSDHGGYVGAAMVALIEALEKQDPALILAADKRLAKPGSPAELTIGHGGAAVLTGTENPIATILADHVVSEDFIDHYRASGADTDYMLEDRWVRDAGQMKLVPPAVEGLLATAALAAADIDHLILTGMGDAAARLVAKSSGFNSEQLTPSLSADCGYTGTAHPLLLLATTLESAQPGETILIVNFAQGIQCLLIETTEAISAWQPVRSVSAQLAAGKDEPNYCRFLSFGDQLPVDWGVRAERDNRTAISAFNRHRKTVTGFIGGKCTICGAIQFPKTVACVAPDCRAFGTLIDEPFADKVGRIRSFTEDYLAISENPPLLYGNVAFDDGGVLLMEFADAGPGELAVGQQVRFVFRVKDKDPKRRFQRYFWKAVPVERSGEA
ncbi:3-oxoacyl-[acyl-carrier-protein] synthase III C-terminal domain-containing protein [Parasphingorhabdus sp.]|uniref:3-oxoacyl-[acyl-carrier-protein] synthase III C-terminal domain-containing protein n=1 Tax=Parasphingorhabdus sp. TaxID=2709688 RepID=UPI0039E448F0